MLLLSGFEESSEMSDQVHLKVLVPSIAAGAIIGKGGETITQIQKETGANIKMSKANDFYPGERFLMFVNTSSDANKPSNVQSKREKYRRHNRSRSVCKKLIIILNCGSKI